MIGAVKQFFRNIRYLRKVSLKERLQDGFYEDLSEKYIYELYDVLHNLKIPKIKNTTETIEDIIAFKASMCRFGDGEMNLLYGIDIPFQKASPLLSARLEEVLLSPPPPI